MLEFSFIFSVMEPKDNFYFSTSLYKDPGLRDLRMPLSKP